LRYQFLLGPDVLVAPVQGLRRSGEIG
jgi:hypothetical protein